MSDSETWFVRAVMVDSGAQLSFSSHDVGTKDNPTKRGYKRPRMDEPDSTERIKLLDCRAWRDRNSNRPT